MAQSFNLGGLGQFLTVNVASNTATFANAIFVGGASVNVSINATTFSGTSNNSLRLGGTLASGYQTTAGLTANVAILTANNANNLGGVLAASYLQNTGAYTISGIHTYTANLVINSPSGAAALIINGPILANGALPSVGGQFLTCEFGGGNVYWSTILTTNNTSYVGSVSAANVVSNAQLSANLANYTNTAGLASYQTTAGLSGNVAILTANNANNLGGTAAASYVKNTDSRALSGNINFTGANTYFSGQTTYNANIVINTGANILDSTGSQGQVNQVLTSNGSGNVYWSTPGAASVNLAISYSWTNTHTFNDSVTIGSVIIANGSAGSSGWVLTSNGTTGSPYWAAASGGGGGGGGAAVTVSNTLPISPNIGDLWFNSNDGNLKVYYYSNGYFTWVDANLGGNPTYNVTQNKQAIAFSLVFGGF